MSCPILAPSADESCSKLFCRVPKLTTLFACSIMGLSAAGLSSLVLNWHD